MMKPTKMDAVLLLRPNAICTLSDDKIIWQDENQTAPTDEEIQKKYDELVEAFPLNELREERDFLLQQSDWVVIKEREEGGSVSNFADWKEYRQKLRDITNTYKSLEDVKWPEKP